MCTMKFFKFIRITFFGSRNDFKRKRDAESMDEDSNSLLWKQVNRSSEDTTSMVYFIFLPEFL